MKIRRQLTEREMEVAILLCSHCMTDRQVARHLSLAVKTVATHRAAIYRKLGVIRTSQLCKWYWTELQ